MTTKDFMIEYINNPNMEFFILDIETTGLSKTRNEIIEIGVLKIKNKEIIDQYHSYVHIDFSIPYKIVQLTKITNEMIKNAPTFKEVLIKLKHFLGKKPIIMAHNYGFDKGFLEKKYLNLNDITWKIKNIKWINSIYIFKLLYPKLQNYKLDTIIDSVLNASSENRHNAIADTKNLFYAFKNKIVTFDEQAIKNFKYDVYGNNFHKKNTDINNTYNVKNIKMQKFFKGKKVTFTGSLKVSRIAIIEKINKLGGIATGSLKKDTEIIIVGCNPGSKLKKAQERGITIISEEKFDIIISKGHL